MKHDERQISMFAGAPSGESLNRGDRGGTVPLSFLPRITGKSPGMRACQFLALLRIPEGKKAGKPLKLAKFQKSFVKGTFRPDVMVGVLSIGRGNAKTALAAGLALAELVGALQEAPQPKREIIFAARNRDQARIAFNFLVGYLEGLPEADQELFTIRRGSKLEVEFQGNGGGLARVIAADGKSVLGGAPTLAILDERAAWEREKGDSLENAILSGLGKRDGRALIISTSAPDDANTFSRWLDEPPPGTFIQEHRPPMGLPADDPNSLLIANPGAIEGIGATPDWLVAQARRAIARGGSALSSFRNLNRNERVSTEDRSVLVTVDEWMAAEVDPDQLPPRDGPCVLGVDLGGSRSMSAAAFYWPDTGRLEALGTFPAFPSLADRGAADGVSDRYVQMNERGELSVMGENTVPPGRWLAEVVKHLDGQTPVAIVGDRFRHAEFVEAMQGAGLARVPFIWRGFGWKDSAEDIERFRRALFDGEVKVAPSMLLRFAFADAITLVDPAGNHKLAKARSLGRIDAAAAAVIAIAQGARMKATPQKKARALWT
ncbi:terminase large subunit domain-containing protein [Roseinatronobacter bogoriensis]|uniref:Terminase n=1 Tax=Roseinatronobacter bogoriensis subsp. barguzinensis TaxID=441209 RepID=A0A2K8K4R8_9RHOB|nr:MULTISPECIES: terminase large subunit [Rhodobaca]ATX64452.1 terminase [Rhodobaca barguzinensis]MBB4209157.1 phage terminase large subunit-like protein [Rhodobaca bogoriensis DSM 18756]TDW36315.1 phage terminase large subunit-like protein [Rhodobaca barguzinensis]TDY67557.1 phage terminase large subunit-like protein [Rhodobaca bogoriensis DSM 18756]